jgi:carboxyl-terminal processing protease
MKRIHNFIVLLVFVLATYTQSVAADTTYEGLSNFTRVLDLVERNYVEEVDPEKLTNSAIDGMLKTLDPYSTYLSPERYRELEIGTSGEFGGVGMEVSEENGVLVVITPIEGSPAEKAGIKPLQRKKRPNLPRPRL